MNDKELNEKLTSDKVVDRLLQDMATEKPVYIEPWEHDDWQWLEQALMVSRDLLIWDRHGRKEPFLLDATLKRSDAVQRYLTKPETPHPPSAPQYSAVIDLKRELTEAEGRAYIVKQLRLQADAVEQGEHAKTTYVRAGQRLVYISDSQGHETSYGCFTNWPTPPQGNETPFGTKHIALPDECQPPEKG